MGESGVPEVVNGVDIGYTDFSEFAVQGTLPSGITAFGICGGESPTDEEIKNDASEGNYFFMDGHSVQSWGYGLDAFDALLSYGELLARVYVNVSDNRRGIGPAINLSGLIGQPCGSPDFDGEGGGVFLRAGVDIESAGSVNNDGSGTLPVNGTQFRIRQTDACHEGPVQHATLVGPANTYDRKNTNTNFNYLLSLRSSSDSAWTFASSETLTLNFDDGSTPLVIAPLADIVIAQKR